MSKAPTTPVNVCKIFLPILLAALLLVFASASVAYAQEDEGSENIMFSSNATNNAGYAPPDSNSNSNSNSPAGDADGLNSSGVLASSNGGSNHNSSGPNGAASGSSGSLGVSLLPETGGLPLLLLIGLGAVALGVTGLLALRLATSRSRMR